jgi:hypothetical protein
MNLLMMCACDHIRRKEFAKISYRAKRDSG